MANLWMCSEKRVGKLGANLGKRSQGHLVLTFLSVWQFKVKGAAELVVKGLSQKQKCKWKCLLCYTSVGLRKGSWR